MVRPQILVVIAWLMWCGHATLAAAPDKPSPSGATGGLSASDRGPMFRLPGESYQAERPPVGSTSAPDTRNAYVLAVVSTTSPEEAAPSAASSGAAPAAVSTTTTSASPAAPPVASAASASSAAAPPPPVVPAPSFSPPIAPTAAASLATIPPTPVVLPAVPAPPSPATIPPSPSVPAPPAAPATVSSPQDTSGWVAPIDPPAEAGGIVALNLPEEMDLRVLIDYVGKRQGVSFLIDDAVTGRVCIKAPKELPVRLLMTLLEGVLRMKGLAVTPTDVPGMMRIEAAKPLTTTAVGPNETPDTTSRVGPTLAMTRIFQLQHASPQRVEQVIKPFLSAPTANIIPLDEHDLLIVTDYVSNMKRLEDMITVVDRARRDVVIRTVPIVHSEATSIAQQVTQLLAAKTRSRGAAAKADGGGSGTTVLADDRTNQVIVLGSADEVAEAVDLVKSFDVSLGLETRIYSLAVASPEQVDQLVKKLIGDLAAKRFYKSATDRDAGLLIVTTTPEIHEQVEVLRKSLDKPQESQNPIRFYKLKHAKATEVLGTLQSIEGDKGLADVSVDGVSGGESRVATDAGVKGSPAPAAAPTMAIKGPSEAQVNLSAARGAFAAGGGRHAGGALNLQGARVMADEPSNTIIVIAAPSMQAVYEKLIERLDVRRPQVQIEATVVLLDTTGGYSLGVELFKSYKIGGDQGTALTFSAFGLSSTDSTTGALTLKPGIGFNGAVLGTNIANAVIHALESDTRAKVLSRPTVLVNDNAKGVLASEKEEPFSSLNANNTISTTSFAGYATAGTKITITPQISESDQLKLEYEIELSSFDNNGTSTLPPSRQTNSLKSEVTIPNGSTIVVGGLTQDTLTESVDRVPGLGRIPGLEYLFSNRSHSTTQSALFVFIRAVILRDDKFEDLKSLSGDAAQRAGLPSHYPSSVPVEIR
jgi:type II secretion system protein D